ncbi:hypothetical protein N665_0008s0187 [Sinapis alba]|nr:hypothetical protein N665_0008s0187 [Sinapis alba]
MSLIRRMILGRRSFCTFFVPRNAEDIMENPDCRSWELSSRVSYLANSVGDLVTATRYSLLAAFSRPDDEPEVTLQTCETIIGSMVRAKRHEEAYYLYDYFFNKHTLKPNSSCCNLIIESRLQQGLVDEALDFHRTVKGMVPDYPSEASLRVLTKGLVRSGRFDLAQAFLKGSSDTFPDHVAFKYMIQGFLAVGNLDKANHLFEEFKRSLSSSIALRNKSTFEFLHQDCPLYEHSRYAYPEYENRVAFLMATFMDYWFKQGKEVEAMELYNESVPANKLLLCPETANALLKVLLKHGQKSHASALYNDMLAQCKTRFDTIMVQTMLNEYCSSESGIVSEPKSRLAYSLGSGDKFVPDTTLKTILDSHIKAGRIDEALKTSNKMFDVALKEVSEQFNPL